MVLRVPDILAAPGLREACRILFGDAAEERLAEYVRDHGPKAAAGARTARDTGEAAQA
jgi:hypothetical protein